MGKKTCGCDCSDCQDTARLAARWRLLEVLGSVCGVDGFEIMVKWCLKSADGNVMYVVYNDDPFFAVCSSIVAKGRR
jgi:hypothetical protein